MEQVTWGDDLVHECSLEDGLPHVRRIGYHGFKIPHRDAQPCVQDGPVV